MRVVFCAAEVAPFSQAGGLGDVAGSLPPAVAALGEPWNVECLILTPLYGLVDRERFGLQKLDIEFDIQLAGKAYTIGIWQAALPNSNVPVYFMENYELFGAREQVYPYGRPEWELEGFLVFNQAVFEFLRRLNYRPDILHVHDWHTGSIAATLSDIRPFDQYFSRTFSVLTIHNLSYQGIYGETNCLREGILQADGVTTVSPTYAREILTPEYGAGLDGVMRDSSHKLTGILNGIDTLSYNPATDPHIAENYDDFTFVGGKAKCKAAIQSAMGLPVDPTIPLAGFVGRLVDQKGVDILMPVMRKFEEARIPLQWAILGTGDPAREDAMREWAAQSQYTRVNIGFDLALARQIYAGSDFFVMPSAFEPCGLGQMIALRYGTVPVVHAIGGLADTIFDIRQDIMRGNGFRFDHYSMESFELTLKAAVDKYRETITWQGLIQRTMREDHSWRTRAIEYARLYSGLVHPTTVNA